MLQFPLYEILYFRSMTVSKLSMNAAMCVPKNVHETSYFRDRFSAHRLRRRSERGGLECARNRTRLRSAAIGGIRERAECSTLGKRSRARRGSSRTTVQWYGWLSRGELLLRKPPSRRRSMCSLVRSHVYRLPLREPHNKLVSYGYR